MGRRRLGMSGAAFVTALLIAFSPATGVAMAATSPSPSPVAASGANLCDVADDLLAGGHLNEASRLYGQIAPACSSGPDVIEQRTSAAEALVVRAEALAIDRETGGSKGTSAQKAQARDMLVAATLLDPRNDKAKKYLTQLGEPRGRDLCTVAQERLDEGDVAGAKALFEEAAKNDDTQECGTAGLVAAADSEGSLFPTRLIGVVTGPLMPWITLSALGVLAALIISVLWSAGRKDPLKPERSEAKSATRIGRLLAAGAAAIALLFLVLTLTHSMAHRDDPLPTVLGVIIVLLATVAAALIGWALGERRRLTIATVTASKDLDTTDLTALIVAEFAEMVGGRSAGIDQVNGTDLHESPLASVTALVPNKLVQALVTLWKTLTPGVDLSLRTHIHADKDGKELAVVQLSHGRAVLDEQRIELARLVGSGAALDPRDVASAVAAWTVVHLRDAMRSDERLYGATAWEGIMLTAIAGRRKVDDPLVLPLLTRAVGADGGNKAARFGLLSVRLRQSTPTKAADVDRLRTFVTELTEGQESLPLGWRARYALAAALGNRAQALLQAGTASPDIAQESLTLLESLIETLLPWVPSAPPPAVGTGEVEVAGEASGDVPAEGGGFQELDRDLARRLHRLADEARRAVLVTRAASDPSRQPRPLAEAESAFEAPNTDDVRAHYTRACVFGAAYSYAQAHARVPAAAAVWLDRTLEELRAALIEPRLTASIAHDPYLADVVDTPQFRALVRRPPKHPQADFAELDCLGGLAPVLVAMGQPDAATLRTTLSDPTDRVSLLARLSISDPALVREWCGAVEWMAATNSVVNHINLVQRAGHPDTAALSTRQAEVLARQLRVRHEIAGYDGDPPTYAALVAMGALR